jgi:hypothetical protein
MTKLRARVITRNRASNSAVHVRTPANTLTMGLDIVQSGPTMGTTAGPWSYNLITVTDSGNVLSAGASHDDFDLFKADSSAFRVNATHGGDEPPIRIVGTFASNFTGVSSNAETVGVIGSTYSNTTVGALWGTIGYSSIGPAGTVSALIPVAAEVSAQTGSHVLRRMAYAALSEGPVLGSIDDAALLVAGQDAGRGLGGFKNVIRLTNTWFGAPAMDASANFFSADSATTMTNFINAGNVEIGGEIFLFKNLNVPGAAPGFVLPAHQPGSFQFGSTAATGVQMMVNAFTGPAIFASTRANTSSTAPSAVLANETIGGMSAQPYDGTSYSEVGGVGVHAAQNLTASAHGSYTSFFTTPLNSTTITEQLRLNAGGLLGIGTTDNYTTTNYATVLIGSNAALQGERGAASASHVLLLSQNGIYNGATWNYISTDAASNYYQISGTHNFRVAASGTAGTAITWIDALKIKADGKINIPLGLTNAVNDAAAAAAGVAIGDLYRNGSVVMIRVS